MDWEYYSYDWSDSDYSYYDYYSDESGSCEDDMYWADSFGDGCDWYNYNAGSCGYYGEGAFDACCVCRGYATSDSWSDSGDEWDVEDMDWEWVLEEGEDLLPQGETSWSLGPITVTYDSAATKMLASFGAAALAVALLN